MGYNIKFSVHRNPQKDSEGNDTYQVGHSTEQTEEQVKMRLEQWFSSHEMLTCRQMMGLFGITRLLTPVDRPADSMSTIVNYLLSSRK